VIPKRKPAVPRPRGPVGNVAASLARRKAAREPRVVLTESGGHPRTLHPSDPVAERVLDAAERLVSAAQSGSAV
jgi:hypothetical protein